MPKSDSWCKADILAFLESVSSEKCCAVCYHVYLSKYLDSKSRSNLLQVGWDCCCDFKESEKVIKGKFDIKHLSDLR